MEETLLQALIGPGGKLRAIWRAVIYYVVGTAVLFPALGWPIAFLTESLHLDPGLTAGNIALAESRNFPVALLCTGAFALLL